MSADYGLRFRGRERGWDVYYDQKLVGHVEHRRRPNCWVATPADPGADWSPHATRRDAGIRLVRVARALEGARA